MRQLLLNSIEIKRIIDVGSTTYFYLLMPSIAAAPSKPTVSPPPTYETEGYSGWSETEPSYTSGDTRSLYTTVRTIYSDGSFEYTTPSLSSSYEAAKQAYNRAQSAFNLADGINNYFWSLASSDDPDVPTGAYVTSIPRSRFITEKTGGNVIIQSTGITIRNGLQQLASLSGQTLNFYQPTSGYLTMSLSGNSLNFYNPTNNNNNIQATLNTNGLILKKGGIEAGEKNTSNYIYVYSDDDATNHTLTINGHETSDWRIVAGNKFGVDKAGNLYANSADISGKINAIEGTIGGWTINDSYGIYTNSKTTATSDKTGVLIQKDGAIYAGAYDSTAQACPFQVNSNGVLNATGATIKGALTATSLSTGTKTAQNTGTGVFIDGSGNIYAGSGSTNNFSVTSAGVLTAKSGTIGGWTIGNTFLSTTSTGTPGDNVITLSKGIAGPTTATGILPANQTWAFTASNQFGVTTAGKLYASGADISGKITATEGTIGGASISNGTLKIKDANIESISGSKITAHTITIGNIASDTQSQILNSVVNIDTRNYWRAIDSSKRTIGVSRVTYTYDGEGTYVLTCNNASTSGYAQIYTSEWFDATDLAGKTVIFHADSITTTNSSAADRVYLAMQNASGQGLAGQFLNSSNLSKVITLPQSLAKMQLIIRMDQNKAHAVGDVMTVVKPKLEIGYQATGWTQAPEDVDADIADSAKVATNYIAYASADDGIKVHNYNDNTDYVQVNSTKIAMYRNSVEKMQLTDSLLRLGDISNYAKIDADGMEVYKGGTSVAQFGETVRLGVSDRLELSENRLAMVSGADTPFLVENPEEGVSLTKTMRVVTNDYQDWYDLPSTLTAIQVIGGTTADPGGTMESMAIPTTDGATTTVPNSHGVKFTLKCSKWWSEPHYSLIIENATTIYGHRYAKVQYTYTDNGIQVTVNDAKLNVTPSNVTVWATTAGKIKTSSIITYGHVAVINMQIQTTSSTAAGGNLFEGCLWSLKPVGGCRLSGYYGSTPVLGGISDTGDIIIKNCGTSSLSVTGNNFISVGGTFIFDDASW